MNVFLCTAETVWDNLDLSFNAHLLELTIKSVHFCTRREINTLASTVLPSVLPSIEELNIDIHFPNSDDWKLLCRNGPRGTSIQEFGTTGVGQAITITMAGFQGVS
jgi:hypothetical protein